MKEATPSGADTPEASRRAAGAVGAALTQALRPTRAADKRLSPPLASGARSQIHNYMSETRDDTSDEFTDSNADAESSDPFTLLRGWKLVLSPKDDGEKADVALYDTRGDGEPERCVSVVKTKDFYNSAQKVGEIGNEFRAAVEDEAGVDGDDLKTEFKSKCSVLAENDDDVQRGLYTETVTDLLAETESVEYVRGADALTVRVTLTHGGETREMEFSPGEWRGASGDALGTNYLVAFAEMIEVSKQEWADLRDEWDSRKEVVEGDTLGEWGHIADQLTDNLIPQIDAFDDREKLLDDRLNAYYQEDAPEYLGGKIPAGDHLWVRAAALRDELPHVGKQTSKMGELSRALVEEGYLRSDQPATRKKQRVYAFDPESLGVDADAVLSDDDGVGGVDV